MRVPSGELCCVILIDLVGCDCSCDGGRLTGVMHCDCSCDGGRLTGVMHFGYMRRTAMLVTCGVISCGVTGVVVRCTLVTHWLHAVQAHAGTTWHDFVVVILDTKSY